MAHSPTLRTYDERTRRKNERERRMRNARNSAADSLYQFDHSAPACTDALERCVSELRNLLSTVATPRQQELLLQRYPGVLPTKSPLALSSSGALTESPS